MSALTDSSPGFSIPGRYARGRILRIGPALNEVMEAHAYPAPLAELLAEALVLAGVFGSTLKEAGGLRGYIQHDADPSGGGAGRSVALRAVWPKVILRLCSIKL